MSESLHHPGAADPEALDLARLQRWDIWCRVIDNHGDLGVSWRLARGLAARGVQVRLYVDDASALAWMAPQPVADVSVHAWHADDAWPPGLATQAAATPADGVIEAFGCDPPAFVVAAMAQRQPPPVWLNLEYLSAEDYVERSHRLPSPQHNGLTKWFFYPGTTRRTGGLLREDGLLQRRTAFDAAAWLAERGWAPRPGERVASLFCYDNPALPALLQRLGEAPTLLLATPGAAQQAVQHMARAGGLPPLLRSYALPWLAQDDYDRLLWACDLNFVRGEDSLVRAMWAGAPWVWQIYPQQDGAHGPKLQALLSRMQAPADVAGFFLAWNGLAASEGAPPRLPALPETGAWQKVCIDWRSELAAQDDLVSQLLDFARSRCA